MHGWSWVEMRLSTNRSVWCCTTKHLHRFLYDTSRTIKCLCKRNLGSKFKLNLIYLYLLHLMPFHTLFSTNEFLVSTQRGFSSSILSKECRICIDRHCKPYDIGFPLSGSMQHILLWNTTFSIVFRECKKPISNVYQLVTIAKSSSFLQKIIESISLDVRIVTMFMMKMND